MARGKVTVFGGTGFLGQRVVLRLLERDFSVRIASRHPERTEALFPDVGLGIESIHADINDDRSVAAAVAAVEGVVNAVSFYVESGQETFHSVHVTGATREGEMVVLYFVSDQNGAYRHIVAEARTITAFYNVKSPACSMPILSRSNCG